MLLLPACGDLTPPPPRTTEARATTAPRPDKDRFGGNANFVLNPSFETGVRGWSPWTSASAIELSRQGPKVGRAAALVRAAEPAPYGIQLLGLVSKPMRGDVYELTAWLRSADRKKRLTLLLIAYGGTGETVAQRVVPVGTVWQQVRMRGRLRSSRESLSFFMGQLGSIGAGDGFFVDGVTLYLDG